MFVFLHTPIACVQVVMIQANAVAYVKLCTVVMLTGYHCHVAYNTVECISSQKNAAGMIMFLLATHLHALLNGLCRGNGDRALRKFWAEFG